MRFVDSGADGWRDATDAASRLAQDPPDAVICYDDKLALSLLDALRATDLDVPRDMALVGFDGIPAARQSRPRLTTVDVPSVELGRRAVDMLRASIRDGSPAASQIVPVELIVGESTPPSASATTPASRRRERANVAAVAARTVSGR